MPNERLRMPFGLMVALVKGLPTARQFSLWRERKALGIRKLKRDEVSFNQR